MAEAAGLALGVLGLAGLFSTGIECFAQFRSAQRADKEVDDLLCKLDLGKARLLIWGDKVGILKSEGDGRSPYLDQHPTVIEEVLRKVIGLLSNEQSLIQKYGIRRQADASDKQLQQRDEISRNAMSLFSFHWNVLKQKIKPKNTETNLSTVNRAIWAVWDKRKFEGLIQELSDYIDSLNEFIPVAWQVVEDTIVRDMVDAAMSRDIARLRLVERACDGPYNSLAAKVQSVISQSEAGTLDQRPPEEMEEDHMETPERALASHSTATAVASQTGAVIAMTLRLTTTHFSLGHTFYLPEGVKSFFVVTDPCVRFLAGSPCDQATLGEDIFKSDQEILTERIDHFAKRIYEELDLAVVSFVDSDKLLEWEMTFHDAMTNRPPIALLLVYCAPCSCQIRTAARFARSKEKPNLVEVRIRVDYRLKSSCVDCVDFTDRLRNFAEAIGDRIVIDPDHWILGLLDDRWIEQQIRSLEEGTEEAYLNTSLNDFYCDYFEERRLRRPVCAGAVIFGEADDMCIVMNRPPFKPVARMPRPTEIYLMSAAGERRYFGNYIRTQKARALLADLAREPTTSTEGEYQERGTQNNIQSNKRQKVALADVQR